MGEMANQLRKFGHEASVVYAGNTPGDGTRDDVMPRNERQRKAADTHPAKESDLMVGSIPLISQRMLAAAAGVGFFGMSGNILTMTHGAGHFTWRGRHDCRSAPDPGSSAGGELLRRMQLVW